MFTDFVEIYQTSLDCQKLIDWFNINKELQGPGVISEDNKICVKVDKKDTTDISLSLAKVKNDTNLSEIFYPLFLNLKEAFEQYIKKYNILEDIKIEVDDRFNIQHYKSKQHFKKFHFESSGSKHRKRILTWMVYLNDVPNGGHTVFPYYNYTIQPIKGHILIWPAEFTHTHFGDTVIDEKYIATGWFNLLDSDEHFSEQVKTLNEEPIYFNV